MSSRFDGLRTILGNNAVAVPEVEAVAVEQPVVAAIAAEPPVDVNDDEEIPGLAELDRGVYRGAHKNNSLDASAALDALDQGLGEPTPRRAFADAPDRTARTASSSGPAATLAVEREVSGWAAVAVMAFGLVLGAIAAAAVFHNDLSHILASMDHR